MEKSMFDLSGAAMAEAAREKAYSHAKAQNAINTAYVGEPSAVEINGLLRLADQISEAAARIDHLADNLTGLALALHGPRPEPVNEQTGKVGTDSLMARVNNLMVAVERAQRAYEGVMR